MTSEAPCALDGGEKQGEERAPIKMIRDSISDNPTPIQQSGNFNVLMTSVKCQQPGQPVEARQSKRQSSCRERMSASRKKAMNFWRPTCKRLRPVYFSDRVVFLLKQKRVQAQHCFFYKGAGMGAAWAISFFCLSSSQNAAGIETSMDFAFACI